MEPTLLERIATPGGAGQVYAELYCYRLVGETNILLEGVWKFVPHQMQKWSAEDVTFFHELCIEVELDTTIEDAQRHLDLMDEQLSDDGWI